MAQRLWLRAFQTVHYRIPFFTQPLTKFLSKSIFWIIILFSFLFFYNLKKIKSNSLLTVWYALDKVSKPLSHQIISNLSKITLDHQTAGRSFYWPIVPSYHIQDYWIFSIVSVWYGSIVPFLWFKMVLFCTLYTHTSVMRVGSDTFGDPIFQKGLQN